MDGGFFDFNGDGHLNAGEAAFMGMLGTKFAKQAARATEDTERQANEAPWKQINEPDDTNDHDDDGTTISIYDDDPLDLFEDDDEDYDIYDEDFDDLDENEIDTSSRSAIMRAFNGGTYFEDLDYLVEEATNRGVRFTPEDIIDLSYELWDQDLLVQLIAHSKPRFLQEHADELAPRWGSVQLEYQEEEFDEESNDGHTYHVNLLEEEW